MLTNSGTLPWAFIQDKSCKVDLEMNGFGMRDSTQFVVSGLIETANIGTDCPALQPVTGSGSGNFYNFVSSQSVSGKISLSSNHTRSGLLVQSSSRF